MKQDRKTLKFDSRPVTFQLLNCTANKKTTEIGHFALDLSDYCLHKLEKTQIFTVGSSGYTVVISIICNWKSFNGDLVDNYEKGKKIASS